MAPTMFEEASQGSTESESNMGISTKAQGHETDIWQMSIQSEDP